MKNVAFNLLFPALGILAVCMLVARTEGIISLILIVATAGSFLIHGFRVGRWAMAEDEDEKCELCGQDLEPEAAVHYVCTCSSYKLSWNGQRECYPVPICNTCYPTMKTVDGHQIPEMSYADMRWGD